MNKVLIVLFALILSACDANVANRVLNCDNHKTDWVYSAYMTEGGSFIIRLKNDSYYYYTPKPGEICRIITRDN